MSEEQKKQIRAEVDRIEAEDVAVVLLMHGDEYLGEVALPLELLPEGTAGGQHLRVTFERDEEAERAAAASIAAMLEELDPKQQRRDTSESR